MLCMYVYVYVYVYVYMYIRSVRRLLVTANVPSSSIHVTLMVETLLSYETTVLTGLTGHNITEDGILPRKLF
jgi:hypothetical protein